MPASQDGRAPHLDRAFFARPTLEVARDLLGKRLVRIDRGRRLSGVIVETEAYVGEDDQASHARPGRTRRNAVMYGPPGHAYVYFTYGMHWMLNFVTEPEGFPAAVLLRAILPGEGLQAMRRRRGQPDSLLTDGPAKITQALGITGRFNGHDLCAPTARLFIESLTPLPPSPEPVVQERGMGVRSAPRVGLGRTPEPWLSKPWNFRLELPT